MGKIASYLSRGTTFQTRKINRSKVEIVCRPYEGCARSAYQCENRKGSFEAVAMMFSNELATLEHPVCIHRAATAVAIS